jgi:hypothetical protein
MQLDVDLSTKPANPKHMENIHPYEAGKNDMREELLALAYDKYCFLKKWHGKDSVVCDALKGFILDVREAQALEIEKAQQTETASE